MDAVVKKTSDMGLKRTRSGRVIKSTTVSNIIGPYKHARPSFAWFFSLCTDHVCFLFCVWAEDEPDCEQHHTSSRDEQSSALLSKTTVCFNKEV